MSLSKVFDTIRHELVIAKLYMHRFSKDTLKLILSYMSDHWQRNKIIKLFSSWSALLQGVPQGSVLGPILFNICLNDLFHFLCCDVCNFADGTIPVCSKNVGFVYTKFEEHSIVAIEWFENNYLKMNSDKCHHFILGNRFKHIWTNNRIWETRTVKLFLGQTIDNELKIGEHLRNVCLKANRKLCTLTRIRKYLDFKK